MPHVSRYKLSREQIEKISQQLVDVSLRFKNSAELSSFFDDLLTQTEKIMLGKRFLIGLFLERGYSYASIRNILKVSDATIGTISAQLHRQGKGFRLAFERIGHQEKVNVLLKNIEKLF
ncbi:MAG: Trp family transcriptional regulator [bacterium]|nr:Trp family transcriptional regulator [bacterium]